MSYREGYEYVVCEECGSEVQLDPAFIALVFDEEEKARWVGFTCDWEPCGADFSALVHSPASSPGIPPGQTVEGDDPAKGTSPTLSAGDQRNGGEPGSGQGEKAPARVSDAPPSTWLPPGASPAEPGGGGT
jgi:hypothetical protein